MKQNGQWLSHVRTRSNTALARSRPSGAPAALSTVTRCSRPPRRTSSSTRGSSAWIWYRMTSRTISPLSVSSSSPGRSPAAAAGEPGATATTRAVGIAPCLRDELGGTRPRLAWSGARRACAPRPAAGLLRGRGDGDQGPVLDGPGVRAAGVLLPRDRAQPARRRPLPRARAWCSSTTSTRCPTARRSCCRPTARPPRWSVAARDRDRFVVNAVCPLVTKVHHEAKVRAGKGYTVLYVGHEGHDEAAGTLAVAPDAIRLVEHEDDLADGAADGRRPVEGGAARADHALDARLGGHRRPRPRARSPSCGPRPATTSASPPPTARPRCRPSRPRPTPSW